LRITQDCVSHLEFANMSFLSSATPKLAPWRILLVDDEPDIHDITKLTLSRFRLEGRALAFLHAYSGAEAKEVLAKEKDIALVFLDVKFVYATQLGSWSLAHYGTFSRNLYGLAKHLLDLPGKLALPLALWAAFYLHLFTPGDAPASRLAR